MDDFPGGLTLWFRQSPLASPFFSPDFGFLTHTGCEIMSFLKFLTAAELGVQNSCTHGQQKLRKAPSLGQPERPGREQTQSCPSLSTWPIKHYNTGTKWLWLGAGRVLASERCSWGTPGDAGAGTFWKGGMRHMGVSVCARRYSAHARLAGKEGGGGAAVQPLKCQAGESGLGPVQHNDLATASNWVRTKLHTIPDVTDKYTLCSVPRRKMAERKIPARSRLNTFICRRKTSEHQVQARWAVTQPQSEPLQRALGCSAQGRARGTGAGPGRPAGHWANSGRPLARASRNTQWPWHSDKTQYQILTTLWAIDTI